MKSPFPGMDPYLEQYWGDVHTGLMVYMRDQINDQLPGDLQARVEEGISVDLKDDQRTIYPDIQVAEQSAPTHGMSELPPTTTMAVAQPHIIPLLDESPTERHIEIVDPNSGNRVVTAIEVLSPSNKTGETGREAYQRKQREYIGGGVNLVEIDLIRQGTFIVAVPENLVPRN